MKEIILLMFLGHILGMFVSANFEIVDVKEWCEMSKIGICLGGVENGKMIHSNGEFYYVKNNNDLFTYKRVDLKFYRSVREDLYEYNYILRKPFNIYVPESEYDKYEGTLKFILSKWMEAEWEGV